MTEKIILSENLVASSGGEPIEHNYRAVMSQKGGGWIVVVEQPIKGNWHTCSSWYLKTLLFGYPEEVNKPVRDSISIDAGQNWNVDSGMIEALNKAIQYL